ncbi:MAG: prolyl oligopeptidase family serine peptidase [Planctomycetota bacterium]|jgi:acetyl esterase/lipase|nr:prolyl oligopeptidase family serine peptidase [Planctomycetota bacterium]
MSEEIRVRLDLSYGQAPTQAVDIFCPDGVDDEAPLLVLLHGGWWRSGRRQDLHSTALHLAGSGHPCAAIGYRLLEQAGDGTGIVDDLRAGIDRALEEISILGGTDRCVVILAAGAAAIPALALAGSTKRNFTVRGVTTCGAAPTLTAWDNCPDDIARQLQTFAGVHADSLDPMELDPEVFPPVLLIHGDADSEVPVQPARAFYRALLEADDPAQLAILAGAGHHILDEPHTRGGHDALERIRAWLKDV